jgi:hypothetical protein
MGERFTDGLVDGTYKASDLDALVDRWHAGGGRGKPLHDFLGLTWDEYRLWVERPGVEALVADIAKARRARERYLEREIKRLGGALTL